MTQSPEYPDLLWMPPRSYTTGRGGWANVPRVIVAHYTAGSEGPTSAEDGAAYDQRRVDGTSAHYYHDQNSTVQCVRTTDMAHTAYPTGNHIGIHHELCGTRQTRAQWLDPASDATLTNAARQMARDARKYAIPVRHLRVDQLKAGAYGLCGHDDITAAFEGDHTDPGPEFPWDVLLARVSVFLGDQPMPDVLIQRPGHPEVYRANGIIRYHIPNESALAKTRALGGLVDNGKIRPEDDLDAYGYDIGQAVRLTDELASAVRDTNAMVLDVKNRVDELAAAQSSGA